MKMFALTGAKTYATAKKVFVAGEQYPEEQVAAYTEELNRHGNPYFTEVESVQEKEQAGQEGKGEVAEAEPPKAPQGKKTVTVGKKPAPPADLVQV